LPEIHILCISEWCVTECHIIVSIIWQAGLRWALKTGYLANITIQFRTFTVIIAIILRIQMVCKHSAAQGQQRTENKKSKKKKRKEKRMERWYYRLNEHTANKRKELCIVFFGSNNAIYCILKGILATYIHICREKYLLVMKYEHYLPFFQKNSMSRYSKLTGKKYLLSAIISFNFILLRFNICIMRCYNYYCYYDNYRYYY